MRVLWTEKTTNEEVRRQVSRGREIVNIVRRQYEVLGTCYEKG